MKLDDLMNLRGRRALITGGNGHLGRAMADTLGELGCDLMLLDRPNTEFGTLADDLSERWEVEARTLECDLESESARAETISSIKADGRGLDVLINNAGFIGALELDGWAGPLERQSIETWRRAIEVNLTAAFHLCQAFVPELRAGTGGNVINVASIYGEYGPDWRLYEGTTMGNPAAYAASKGGLIQLTRWLATTVGPDVRVNAISPGGVARNQPEAFVRRYESKTPLRRMAVEDDFRGVIAFLASDMSRYVTGQNIMVDGGWGVW